MFDCEHSIFIGLKKGKDWAQPCYSNRWGKGEDPRCIRRGGSGEGHMPWRNLCESHQWEEGVGVAVAGAAGAALAGALALQAVQEYQQYALTQKPGLHLGSLAALPPWQPVEEKERGRTSSWGHRAHQSSLLQRNHPHSWQ